MSDKVIKFQEYWKAYGREKDSSEFSARAAFTFAQLQTHRQYLPLQREVEKLRKQVAGADVVRRCPSCKALLEDHSVYCDNCGTDTPRK
jgi:hypothetical protein